MKEITTLLISVILLTSCTHDPQLDRAMISDDDIAIQPGQTYELILTSAQEKGHPAVLMTNCENRRVLTYAVASWEHDGLSRIPESFKEEYKIQFTCDQYTKDRYTTISALLAVIDTLGNLSTTERQVLIPEGGLKPGDIKTIEVDGSTIKLIKAKATNAYQIEQGENNLYFVLVPRA